MPLQAPDNRAADREIDNRIEGLRPGQAPEPLDSQVFDPSIQVDVSKARQEIASLNPGEYLVLGRGREAEVLYDSDNISRSHALISALPDGRYRLADLASTGGTTVYRNGQEINYNREPIQAGDMIVLAGQTAERLVVPPQRGHAPDGQLDPHMPGIEKVFEAGKVMIGRDPDCDVVVGGGGVSRRHMELSFSDGKFTAKDLGSTNGTMILQGNEWVDIKPGQRVFPGQILRMSAEPGGIFVIPRPPPEAIPADPPPLPRAKPAGPPPLPQAIPAVPPLPVPDPAPQPGGDLGPIAASRLAKGQRITIGSNVESDVMINGGPNAQALVTLNQDGSYTVRSRGDPLSCQRDGEDKFQRFSTHRILNPGDKIKIGNDVVTLPLIAPGPECPAAMKRSAGGGIMPNMVPEGIEAVTKSRQAFTLGSDPDAKILFDVARDSTVAPRHATIQQNEGGDYTIRSLGGNKVYMHTSGGQWQELPRQAVVPGGSLLRLGDDLQGAFNLPKSDGERFRAKVLGIKEGEQQIEDGYYIRQSGPQRWRVPTDLPGIIQDNRKEPAILLSAGKLDVSVYVEAGKALPRGGTEELEAGLKALARAYPSMADKSIKEIHIVDDLGSFIDSAGRPRQDIRALPPDDEGVMVIARSALQRGSFKAAMLEYGQKEQIIADQANQARNYSMGGIDLARRLGNVERNEQVDLYNGIPMINRDSSIRGGVYIENAKGVRPAIFVPETGAALDRAFSDLMSRLERRNLTGNPPHRDEDARESAVIREARMFVEERMPYWKPAAHNGVDIDKAMVDKLTKEVGYKRGDMVNLEEYLQFNGDKRGAGVCLHQALFVCYLVERLNEAGIVPGEVGIARNSTGDGAHAWAAYTKGNGEQWAIDPAQHYEGDVIRAAREGRWRYLDESDREQLHFLPL